MVGENKASTKITAKKKTAAKPAAKVTAKGKPWTFPKNSLEDALAVARAIEDKNAGNPMRAADLGIALGFKTSDWRFLDLLKSSVQYGLTTGSGANAIVSLDLIGEDIVAPSSSSQRQQALLNAFRNVEDFLKVEEFYGGKKLPENEFFENTLVRDFEVPRDRVNTFIDVFTKNLKYIKPFSSLPSESEEIIDELIGKSNNLEARRGGAPKPKDKNHVREFLDTCFVMMPFGDWFNRYYQEIYTPAIREAGFEPLRGDELFSTGSVVEQIWEQVTKSTVLLADLTGKNANVFYELGLAHAARKPVVFTASNIEDVPFDLRHLRVIIYDIREPNWATKLASEVTDYLKNAKSEPEKSIPQPFRGLLSPE